MFTGIRDEAVNRLRTFKYNHFNGVAHRTYFSGGVWSVKTWDGVRLKFVNNCYLAFREIYGYLREGRWTLEPGQVVVDAGACYGEFALYASRLVGPSGKVLMLEPDPKNLAVFDKSCALNGGKPDNLIVVQAGLWKEKTTLEFAADLGGGSAIVGTGKAGSEAESRHVIAIDAVSLEDLLADHGLDRIDFVKMDIEGAEIEVCESSIGRLAEMGTRLAIASYHRREGRQTSELLEPLFREAGMSVQTGFFNHRTTWVGPAE